MTPEPFKTGPLTESGSEGEANRAEKSSRTFFSLLEGALWAVSAVSLTLVLWMLADGYIFQWKAQQALASPIPPATLGQGASPIENARENATVPEDLDRPPIELGTPIATLEIPRLDLSVAIAEGTSSKELQKAVGHVPASARPGETGNIALAGHRDTFFRPLKDIRVGDQIRLESRSGSSSYRVEWTKVVEPSEVSVIGPTDDAVLTLVTCYPFNWVGNAPQRFIVRARREG